ncbi:beta-ketoacyl-[acyl-carrier-protein] synthase family protein [Bacillus bombysepticus]|uniref:beta-ketoacyl-[acyl-carrier-protein] synthase family protein n=1 Tax=Bacillus bombysepticus TaxID=658666 RepID=UPI002079477A|nr:beta-ketoacyl-[acyl-carrier-protein] synthase family protein [Bacillus bombysepticus]USL11089.1 beta-ketoacyl-[acyl-carrier-protein] synthase family protein [Bacillus bombysepticus]
MKKVAVTGMGAVSPLGIGVENYWNNLKLGYTKAKNLNNISSSELFKKINKFNADVSIEIEDFSLNDIERIPSDIKSLDRYIQFAVLAAELAKKDSSLTNRSTDFNSERIGVSLSTAICGTKHMEEVFVNVTNYGTENIEPSKGSPNLYLSSMSNTPSKIIASIIGAEGPCVTLSTGCIGGIDAIGYAYEQILNGDMDIMIAGASEAPITPISYGAFDIINCLSTKHNHDPSKASRPYDENRDGFVLSEGAGIIILEDEEHAKKRGAKIYGYITGFSNTSNALHMTDLVSDGVDLARAIENALNYAKLKPSDIDYINGHGSSTPQNDRCETSAIKKVFGELAYTIPVSSTKSMTGHPLSAASALEIIASLKSLEENILHPTINYTSRDKECDLDYIPNKFRKKALKNVLSIASGFSGLHSAIILESF